MGCWKIKPLLPCERTKTVCCYSDSRFGLDPAGRARRWTMRRMSTRLPPVILALPSPSMTYLNLGFPSAFWQGREGAATARLASFTFPALPIWFRQDRGCRCALLSPWVGAAIWGSRGVGGGMNRREESRKFQSDRDRLQNAWRERRGALWKFYFWQQSSWCRDEFIERHIL